MKRLLPLFLFLFTFMLLTGATCKQSEASAASPISDVANADATVEEGDGFSISPIPDSVFARMEGKSYKANCTVPRSELRYLTVRHYDFEGNEKAGEIVCNVAIAEDLIEIFRALYEAKYPIARISLVDDFDADDRRSMEANNTSCFNFRKVEGSKSLSNHSYGRAIDVNPLINPYVTKGGSYVSPPAGRKYVDRTKDFRGKISHDDLCYKLFKQHGFVWGGDWKTMKDYQHFEKRK